MARAKAAKIRGRAQVGAGPGTAPRAGKERDLEVLALRVEGFSFAEIARRLNLNQTTASAAARRALERAAEVPIEECRRMDVARCDAIIDRYMRDTLAKHPDPEAGRLVLAALAHRAKLLGLEKVRPVDVGQAVMVNLVRGGD